MAFGLAARRAPETRGAEESIAAALYKMRTGGRVSPITYDAIRALPSVSRGLSLIAGTASMMPLDEMRRQGDELVAVPVTSPLLREPSAEVPLEDWVWQHLDGMIVHGDKWGRIVRRDAALRPAQVELFEDGAVKVTAKDRGASYEVKYDGQTVPADDVWHISGRPRSAGPLGRGLVDVARDVLAVGVAGREWARAWFEDGGSPSVVVRQTGAAPAGQGLDDEGRARALKARVMAAVRGNRDPLVIPGWIELDKWPAPTPTEAALVEVLRANNTDVAHHIGVPPELVGGVTGDSMTYANIEARMIDLLVFGVDYWLVKLERKLSRVTAGGRIARFDRQAVLRADAKSTAETLGLLVRSGLYTANEGRDRLNRPRVDGGDVLLWPPMSTSTPTPAPEGGTP